MAQKRFPNIKMYIMYCISVLFILFILFNCALEKKAEIKSRKKFLIAHFYQWLLLCQFVSLFPGWRWGLPASWAFCLHRDIWPWSIIMVSMGTHSALADFNPKMKRESRSWLAPTAEFICLPFTLLAETRARSQSEQARRLQNTQELKAETPTFSSLKKWIKKVQESLKIVLLVSMKQRLLSPTDFFCIVFL